MNLTEKQKKMLYIICQILKWAVFGIFLCYDIKFIFEKAAKYTNSDFASEMILGKILSGEHGIITTSWHYSTELRVLHVAQIMAICFGFTSNWALVRITTNIIILVLYSLTGFYFAYAFKSKDKYPLRAYAPLLVTLLILPHSFNYAIVTIVGMYYYPHLITVFLTLGLFFRYPDLKEKNRIKYSRFILAVIIILSVLTGLGGLREICLLYCPLLIASFIYRKQDKTKFRLSICMMFCVFVGYGLNLALRVLTSIRYVTYLRTKVKIRSFAEIKVILSDIFFAFSSNEWKWVGAVVTVVGILSVIYILIRRKDETGQRIVVMHYILAFLIYMCIYCLTDMEYANRYNIPFIVIVFPIILLALSGKDNKVIKTIIVSLMFCLVLFYNLRFYKTDVFTVDPKYKELVDVIEENGVSEGYASYWDGNILTQLSNGNIEVWVFDEYQYLQKPLFSTGNNRAFLQKVDHGKQLPEGRKFLLINKAEVTPSWEGYFPDENIVYETDEYILYIFDEDEVY